MPSTRTRTRTAARRGLVSSWTLRGAVLGAAASWLGWLAVALQGSDAIDWRQGAALAVGSLAAGLGAALGRMRGGPPLGLVDHGPATVREQIEGRRLGGGQ